MKTKHINTSFQQIITMFNKLKRFSKSYLLFLELFAKHPETWYYSSEAAKHANQSAGSSTRLLDQLVKDGFLTSMQKGKMKFYRAHSKGPAMRSFKIFLTCMTLQPLRKELHLGSGANKMILYGSAARGEDTSSSDLDLLCVTQDKELTKKKISEEVAKIEREAERIINITYKTNVEYHREAEKNPAFHENVENGITLWEVNESNELQGMPEAW
ncbi:hypothetical protein COX85_00355 [Candidatus Micrarchaeota archaeon CG_4_10_14_0_2_um_filter_55_9]|nr:MAG: hypothetical protein COT57_00490 [Candidatus Micrarchaeota archaeon CG09_land_8_20_14_0_10_55_25]PIZ92103.1 MAG: hypothetical protein COX85_00355 [Candidatus Micrarchaeota archaeon CG_4_10_14_0_2_um_filter_55_9]PJD01354.1 MAG: hypothetical protein COU38_01455 [Candidatus Micrarchaeota archaeon CG10_big_fil_rev_8_21_14_0_10_54_18]